MKLLKNKTFFILSGILLLLILIMVFLLGSPENGSQRFEERMFGRGIFEADRTTSLSDSMTAGGSMPSFQEIINQAKTGRINLVSELWALRRQCPEAMSPEDCNDMIRRYIMENFEAPDNQVLAELFSNYLDYEAKLHATEWPANMTQLERYREMMRIRREIFGESDADLIFGLEEARFHFSRNFADFLEETEGMSGDERVARYEQMKRDTYGDYYDVVQERTPVFDQFELETTLRSDDLESLSSSERTEAITELRTKYFGEEGAARMSEVDNMLAEERRSIEAYETAERQYLSENPDVSEAEKESRLRQLRIEHLGEEQADAYERRRALENSQNENNDTGSGQ